MSNQVKSTGPQSISGIDQPTLVAKKLIDGLLRDERRSLARILTELERLTTPLAGELLAQLAPLTGHARVIGITGPPGAGKSTLVNALIARWRHDSLRIAVIAVDPSSPVSGGAILGDRIRMTSALDDDGVFIRSLASDGHLGGLSPAAVRIIDALDAARFDIILLETVGTGQSEIDVAEVADIRVVVCAPGLGDDIQAMKSGLLEIADILIVNKADKQGAEQTRQQLAGALSIRAGVTRDVPLLKTIATSGDGIPDLCQALSEYSATHDLENIVERRRRRARYLIVHAAVSFVRQVVQQAKSTLITELADSVLIGNQSPTQAARELFLKEVE